MGFTWAGMLSLLILILVNGCTTIRIKYDTEPSGAYIYSGQTPVSMQYIGTTPKTESYTSVGPYWKKWYYQFKKDGYYDSQIIEAEKGRSNEDRNVWAILKKKPDTTPQPAPPPTPAPAPENKEAQSKISSGTGFLINNTGHLISNVHVVHDCKDIKVISSSGTAKAQLLFSDEKHDVAVLKIDLKVYGTATFRIGKGIRSGDDVITVGFPLGGVLGSDLKVTKGNVSSMTGVNNDASMLQFSAPVQPGSSGGPLLDNSGNVVGVVSAKLSDIGTLKSTGSLPQNVNFAIKTQVVQMFLESHGIEYLSRSSDKNMGAAEVVDQARRYALNVQCYE